MRSTTSKLELGLLRLPSSTTVEVAGEIDLATADQLRQHLLRAANEGLPVVHLDLTAVAFMDTAGIHALLDGASHAGTAGGHLGVVAASRPVRRVMALAGLGTPPSRPRWSCHPVRESR